MFVVLVVALVFSIRSVLGAQRLLEMIRRVWVRTNHTSEHIHLRC
jgi:hypothetical protein